MANGADKGVSSRRRVSLKVKLVASFLVLGSVPAVILSWYSYNSSAESLRDAAGHRLEDAAVTDGDIIDRNLFERYGDVQAFAANPMARGASPQRQEIVDFLTINYGIYDLMVIVDLDGRIITANGVDGDGQDLDSSALIGRSVLDEEWFTVVASGETPAGGTFYTDAHASPLVGELYDGARLTLPFTAPIIDSSGEMVAIWHNEASFERVVGDVLDQRREAFADQGMTTLMARVVRHDGLVLSDTSDPGAVLNANLVDLGLGAAAGATGERGSEGYVIEADPRTGTDQVTGYAVTDGALGFDGYEWGVLVGQDVDEAAAAADALRRSLSFIAAIVLAATVLTGAVLARSLSGPLRRNVADLGLVGDGDLRVRFSARSNDEVGQMTAALNRAVGSIGATLNKVDTNVRGLGESSLELRSTSQRMAEAATQTSSEANEVAATAEEIAASSTSAAAAMEQMNHSVREISKTTASAASMADRAVEASARTSAQVAKLETSSTDIGGVIDVITTIAEQTNLLALNATIEAARVGEAGKGFAVVANEVKELASQTAIATEEIRAKIEAIQADTCGAIQAISEINGVFENIRGASTTIASAVEEQLVATSTVTDSIHTVTAGTTTISDRIASVASASTTASDGSTQTLQAAARLSTIADELAALLAEFELPDDAPEPLRQ